MAADYEDSAVTDMYEEDVNPDEIMPCASNGTISWDVYAGVRRSTSSFHASSGQRIVLSVFSVEPFHSVRAGIIQPDGSKRYIIANGNDSHVFELTMSGHTEYISRMKQQRVFMLKERILHIN